MLTMDREKVAKQRSAVLYEFYKRNPLEWLRDCVKTIDEHDEQAPVKAFPMAPYVKPIVNEWEKESVLHIAKSRQMVLSWLGICMLLHEAQFYGFRLEAVFSKKEEDAHALVERAKFVYDHQPLWLRNICSLDRKMRDQPYGNLHFKNGSKIKGLAQGKDQVRSYVPSTSLIDEAAFQDKFEETYGACVPCSKKIVTISSADAGFFQRLCEL